MLHLFKNRSILENVPVNSDSYYTSSYMYHLILTAKN
uniref:Uncharacterized protein n=1 Tax=Arundo donax TaxID=35708 RepID=A0A0A8ZGR1_ARUDO